MGISIVTSKTCMTSAERADWDDPSCQELPSMVPVSPHPLVTEALRLDALASLAILDTVPESAFDAIAASACTHFGVAMAAIGFLDATRQWNKAAVGLPLEQPRAQSFIAPMAAAPTLHMMADVALDAQFASNPLVIGEHKVRFFAAAPLVNDAGLFLGAVCLFGTEPRELSVAEREALFGLAREVMLQLALRATRASLSEALALAVGLRGRVAQLERYAGAVAHASTAADALSGAIRLLCADLQYQIGGFWLADEALGSMGMPRSYRVTAGAEWLLTAARTASSLVPGEGVVGRAWLSGKLAWASAAELEATFPSNQGGSKGRVVRGVAVPLLTGASVVAVLELYATEPMEEEQQAALLLEVAELLGTTVQRKRVERRLREADERANALQRSSPDAIIIANAEGRIIDWNAAAELMFGYSEQEALGQPLSLIIPEQYRAAHLAGMKRVIATGESQMVGKTVEMVARRSTGEEFPIQMSVATWIGPSERSFSAILRDIRGRKRAEDAVRMREAAFRMLTENGADIIFRGDADARLTWVSESITAVLGWLPSEMVGQLISTFISPEDLPRLHAALAASSPLLGSGVVRYEARFRTSDGGRRWLGVAARPSFDGDGRLTGRIGSARDIHDEVAARNKLSASELHYRLLADNIADVIVYERDGRMTWVSPSIRRELDLPPHRWIGKSLVDIIHPHDFDAVEQAAAPSRGAERAGARARVMGGDGVYHWIELTTNSFQNGEIIDGRVTSFRVIDERIAIERELEHRVRHDQLTGLLNGSEALRRIDAIFADKRSGAGHNAVLFCDVDKFKNINDSLGHAAGDEALRITAARMADAIRADDLAARMGGDEFMVVLRSVKDLTAAVLIAEKIRLSVRREMKLGDATVTLSLSIGVTLVSTGESIEGVTRRADEGMYAAKRDGRDQVVAIEGPGDWE